VVDVCVYVLSLGLSLLSGQVMIRSDMLHVTGWLMYVFMFCHWRVYVLSLTCFSFVWTSNDTIGHVTCHRVVDVCVYVLSLACLCFVIGVFMFCHWRVYVLSLTCFSFV
jgi:hypothetical protein